MLDRFSVWRVRKVRVLWTFCENRVGKYVIFTEPQWHADCPRDSRLSRHASPSSYDLLTTGSSRRLMSDLEKISRSPARLVNHETATVWRSRAREWGQGRTSGPSQKVESFRRGTDRENGILRNYAAMRSS